jgi:hypothetical protein
MKIHLVPDNHCLLVVPYLQQMLLTKRLERRSVLRSLLRTLFCRRHIPLRRSLLSLLQQVRSLTFGLVFPISIAIVILLAIVPISYEQTIHAYPDGGGAYIVALDNLGQFPTLIAGAALLTDYILIVSVSIPSGVAQITSAFPALYSFRV